MVINTNNYNVDFEINLPEDIKILFLYRYVSLFVTSLFFLLSYTDHSNKNKIFIISCIVLSTVIINYLYIRNRGSKGKIRLLVLVETIGNTLLLIPSGGINSPFVWYSLNTILISSVELSKRVAWISLITYLSSSTWISYLIFNKEKANLIQLLRGESNIILSLVLITVLVQLLSKYIKVIKHKNIELEKTNEELVAANDKIKESMNYTMKLYHTVHLLSNEREKDDLIDLITQYTQKITKSEGVLFYTLYNSKNEGIIKCKGIDEAIEEKIMCKLRKLWNNILNYEIPIEVEIENKTFMLVPIKSNYKVYGILGIEVIGNKNNSNYKENVYQLKFLAELSSILLEKFELEKVNEGLLITEEQNRIANEIHDGVLQRLFSISCGIFTFMKKVKKLNVVGVEEDLNIIRSSINNTMKDLRTAIYGLSWKKDGEDNFLVNIKSYIEEIKNLNNVDINFTIFGNNEVLSTIQKGSIYRIICESIGNGVRHGRAKNIEVSLNIQSNMTLLEIIDDGDGFDIDKVKSNTSRGLGIDNIYNLTYSLKGTIDFNSKKGIGTTIKISVPNNNEIFKKEEII